LPSRLPLNDNNRKRPTIENYYLQLKQ